MHSNIKTVYMILILIFAQQMGGMIEEVCKEEGIEIALHFQDLGQIFVIDLPEQYRLPNNRVRLVSRFLAQSCLEIIRNFDLNDLPRNFDPNRFFIKLSNEIFIYDSEDATRSKNIVYQLSHNSNAVNINIYS